METRWTVLKEVSPSGKTLFKCNVCGRVSQTPEKSCDNSFACEFFENTRHTYEQKVNNG